MAKPGWDIDRLHPIDIVEAYALARQHRFVRLHDHEIEVVIDGSWRTYTPILAWDPDAMSFHVRCSFRLTVRQDRLSEILVALNLMNDRNRTGALTLRAGENCVSFRHGIALDDERGITVAQVEEMVQESVDMCERYYPALLMVNRGGLDAQQALLAAIPETIGIA